MSVVVRVTARRFPHREVCLKASDVVAMTAVLVNQPHNLSGAELADLYLLGWARVRDGHYWIPPRRRWRLPRLAPLLERIDIGWRRRAYRASNR